MAKSNKAKKSSWPKIILILIVVLALVGGAVSFFYIRTVATGTRAVTSLIFEYAKDPSAEATIERNIPEKYRDIADSLITDDIRESLDAKKLIKDELNSTVAEYKLSGIITEEVVDKCVDVVLQDMVERAEYEIVDVKPSFRNSIVTVTVKNIDYVNLANTMVNSIVEDLQNPSSELWSQSGNIVSAALGMLFGGDESDSTLTDIILEALNNYYQTQKSKCEIQEYTGTIEYGVVDGKWTLKSADEELFTRFYGFSAEELGLDLSDIVNGEATTEAK